VFGRVVEGMEVVDRIKSVPVAPRGMHQHVPVTPVTLQKAILEK
jgi:cyclophilin family peptidyl-prolyl cis-trans isomerase